MKNILIKLNKKRQNKDNSVIDWRCPRSLSEEERKEQIYHSIRKYFDMKNEVLEEKGIFLRSIKQ